MAVRPGSHGPRSRVLAAAPVLATGVAGVVAGVATLALHGLDWGLVVAALTCVGALLLLPAGPPRAAAAAGWSVVVLLAARGGPGGDVVVPADVRGLFLVLVGITLWFATALTWGGGAEASSTHGESGTRS